MLVLKFGGTSVADGDAIRRAASIVAQQPGPRAVVVSALAGVTDTLLALTRHGTAGQAESRDVIDGLAARHRSIADGVRTPSSRRMLDVAMDGLTHSALRTLSAISAEGRVTPALADRLLSIGELWSSRLVAALFEDSGIRARWVDARSVIRTDGRHLSATPDLAATLPCADAVIRPLLERDEVAVIAGFLGSGPDDATTTLGRGGSDYSAAVIGACLSADEIQIWTDVNGVLTADPRVVAGARVVPDLSYESAHELARFGAKVLHPRTLEPAASRGIPVRVLNSRRPAGRGTRIGPADSEAGGGMIAVASRRDVSLIEIASRDTRFRDPFGAAVLQDLTHAGATILLADLCGGRLAVAVEGSADLEAFTGRVASIAQVRVRPGLTVVCAVGERLAREPRLLSDALTAVGDTHVHLVVRPSGGQTLAFVIDPGEERRIMTQLHDCLSAGWQVPVAGVLAS